MKSIFKILTISVILLNCLSANNKKHDYKSMLEYYLETKKIESTANFFDSSFNNMEALEIKLLDYKINWRKKERGIEITIDGHTINTADKVTLNPVWGSGVDSVNFANFLKEVKVYETAQLVGFVLTNTPCTGLACDINYQLIYDLKSQKESYFGRFRTGFEFELYHFNADDFPDYLSKTFYGRNAQQIDTTEFVMYSQTENGDFQQFQTATQSKYWFKHICSVSNDDFENESFEEHWVEKINVYDK